MSVSADMTVTSLQDEKFTKHPLSANSFIPQGLIVYKNPSNGKAFFLHIINAMREDSPARTPRTDEAKLIRARQTKLVLTCDVTQMDALIESWWKRLKLAFSEALVLERLLIQQLTTSSASSFKAHGGFSILILMFESYFQPIP